MAHNIVGICGSAGAGKTVLHAAVVSRDAWAGCQCVVYDPMRDMHRALTSPDLGHESVAVCKSKVYALEALDKGYSLVCLSPDKPSELPYVTEAFIALLSNPRPDHVYAIDECEHVFPNVVRGTSYHGPVSTAQFARNDAFNLRLTYTCKSPQDISPRLRAWTTDVCVMHLDSDDDVKDGLRRYGISKQCSGATSLARGKYYYRPPFREDANAPLRVCDNRGPLPFPPHERIP